MIERVGLTVIALVGTIVSLAKVPVFPGEIIAQLATPTPPVVIPAWILGGGNFYGGQQATAMPGAQFYDVDPGATADQSLFAGVIDASDTADTALGMNCPGIGSGGSNVSNCQPYEYINMGILLCDTPTSIGAFNYLNNTPDETGFLHTYVTPPPTQSPAPANRLTQPGSCASPAPTFGPNNGFLTNPGDSGFQSWLATYAWTTTVFPTPYGILEDNFSVVGWPCSISYEYGNALCNNRGTSASPAPGNWETELGSFESSAETNCATLGICFAFIANGLTLGGGLNTGPCVVYETSNCFVSPSPGVVTAQGGVIDDKDDLAKLCLAADSGGNLRGIEAEEIVFLKGAGGTPPPVYADSQTIVYMINTMSHLVQTTSGNCKNTVAIDVEASGGSFYPLNNYTQGTVAGGIPVRMEAAALRFLVPNPSTLVPDRMQPLYYTVGGTNNHWTPAAHHCATSPYCEVPYFFEETLVPQGPEVSVGAFTWNGATQSVGDGCPSPNPGDTGGAVDLMVECVTADTDPGAAVFRQEYQHLYINGTDYGPAAVLLNTASTTRVPIDSSWFSCSGCSPISSFHYKLAITTGELASVTYGSGTISLPCTQPTYCNGDNTVSGNTATFEHAHPGNIDAHSGIILFGSN